ncbi:MAG: dihydropteroate synthase [Prevotellaceae bacterium]|nr:dihydropteroate synthase [Prevotellaceae bacterium]
MKIFKKKQTINYEGRLLDLSTPVAMGILNVTPDSFYAQSRVSGEKEIITRAENIISEGGTIIDVGAYSSRPDAANITAEEEYRRLKPAISLIKKHFPETFISVDTFRSDIVQQLYAEFGCFIVNDISSGEIDKRMISSVGKLGLPYIAMHMRGIPATMQNEQNCVYNNIVTDIISYFVDKKKELAEAGVTDVIIDPGFGFGKTLSGNYELLAGTDAFRILEQPILVGISRKSMFYKLLDTVPEKSLPATIAGNMVALQKGADILRVHDVKEACDTIKIYTEIQKFSK